MHSIYNWGIPKGLYYPAPRSHVMALSPTWPITTYPSQGAAKFLYSSTPSALKTEEAG